MAYPKIDTHNKDVVVHAIVYMPNGSRETFRYRMSSASGSVKKTSLNAQFVADSVRMGLEIIFGKKGVVDE